MSTQQLLQPDMGVHLPTAVRDALHDMGTACNLATAQVVRAYSFQLSSESTLESLRTTDSAGELLLQVTADLERVADVHFEQSVVVLARAATLYAVYASQVATAVISDRVPPLPDSHSLRPSDVITAWGHYLPVVQFPDGSDRVTATHLNEQVQQARQALADEIHQLQGEPISAYDELAAVTLEDDGGEGRHSGFADALHAYAGTLVFALSRISGTRTGTAGPADA